MINSSWDRKLPNHLAIIILLVFASAMAWFTVVTGERIIQNSRDSITFDASRRIIREAPEAEIESQKINIPKNADTKIKK